MKSYIGMCLLFSLALLPSMGARGAKVQTVDRGEELLDERVSTFEMRNGTLFGGVARLSAEPTQLSFAFEYILMSHLHDAPTPEVSFSIHLDNTTIREVLTTLCRADSRYTWTRDGTTVNVYPKETVGDGSYLMNRRLPSLELKGVPAAQDAMFVAVAQLPPPFEQIAFAQAGGDTSFPTPWRATFKNLTLRQALNLIARNIAPRGGWVLSGSREFRTVGFHNQRIHESQTDPE
jgi:hypothetical protein